MHKSCEDLADATPLKKKLAALYDNSSANGGDPTLSAHGGRSSKRSTQRKSEVDLKLKVLQMQRE